MIFCVMVLKIRTVAVSPFARTSPSSTADGPTAELMLPQFPLYWTAEPFTSTWQNV
jgi:hypothetical protein